MALALAFLQQAIAQPVVLVFSRMRWVLFLWAPAHSVVQEDTQPKVWITAVVLMARQRVTHGRPVL
jgi:hypothetical protein